MDTVFRDVISPKYASKWDNVVSRCTQVPKYPKVPSSNKIEYGILFRESTRRSENGANSQSKELRLARFACDAPRPARPSPAVELFLASLSPSLNPVNLLQARPSDPDPFLRLAVEVSHRDKQLIHFCKFTEVP